MAVAASEVATLKAPGSLQKPCAILIVRLLTVESAHELPRDYCRRRRSLKLHHCAKSLNTSRWIWHMEGVGDLHRD